VQLFGFARVRHCQTSVQNAAKTIGPSIVEAESKLHSDVSPLSTRPISGYNRDSWQPHKTDILSLRFINSMAISNEPDKNTSQTIAASGVNGLDEILGGGFTPRRLYLIEGVPGSGKTTLAMQFLIEGARCQEPVLYVTLSETKEELEDTARSHGWSLEGITIREVVPSEASLNNDEQYTMFHPSEVELNETTRKILEEVDRLKPRRVVFDSLSELRLLAGNPLRYRRQILALKQFFAGRNCTVLLLDDMTSADRDLQVQSISHGVILLEQLNPEYGSDRRRLRIVKYRGRRFCGGYHDYEIVRGGLTVFPRLVAAEHRISRPHDRMPSGVPELDVLLGGGIESGTSTLIAGGAGTGKSTIAAQFAAAAADRGQRSTFFAFDESIDTLLSRAAGLGIELKKHVDGGAIAIVPVDPAELTPGEFSHNIQRAVEKDGSRLLVIDSLNGYLNAMPGERNLIIQLHELLMYLGQQNVATLLISAHQGMIGPAMPSPVDATYLADAVILLRYFEAVGEVRQAISVVKKRGGRHERTIREFRMSEGRIEVGEPLRSFRGILTGVPTFEAPASPPNENRRS
jgi:circadian clock protein KaiC